MKSIFFSILLLIVGIFLCAVCLGQENLTITTYYPSPMGVYEELTLLKPGFKQEILLNTDGAGNPSIELRSLDNPATNPPHSPYIDFSNNTVGNNNPDYNYRLILSRADQLRMVGSSANSSVVIARNTAGTDTYGRIDTAELWICAGNVN